MVDPLKAIFYLDRESNLSNVIVHHWDIDDVSVRQLEKNDEFDRYLCLDHCHQ